ncbi:MAG: DUF899 family protein, partial [Hyphomicrobiales bacterium]
MTYQDTSEKMNAYRAEMTELRQKMHALQASIEPQAVDDYTFRTADGTVTLSELFGDKSTLFAIHNMGTGCPYCTLWADGFSGVYPHLADRAAFIVTSPDSPETQAKFKAQRGWTFPMVSAEGSSFAQDMGYTGEHGYEPGVSVFRKDGGHILRVSDTSFGPGDDFCSVWHFLYLIPEGPDGWQPKY